MELSRKNSTFCAEKQIRRNSLIFNDIINSRNEKNSRYINSYK